MFLQEQGFCGRQVRLELLYSGMRDGFAARDFHSKCDGKGPTLTVVQSEGQQRFGGYSGLSWMIAPRMVPYADPEAWLFQLDKQTVMRQTRNFMAAVNHSQNCLVSFGFGENDFQSDLCIYNDCHLHTESFSNLGSTYDLPEGIKYESA